MPHSLELWTDGACSGNPGPGGWSCILVARSADGRIAKQREMSGGEAHTTNNRMELMAVISGLEALSGSARLTVHLDSAYVMDAITKRWYVGWQRNGWMTSSKKPVANQDLWQRLLAVLERHQVSWAKVKGHNGVELNERCDRLAVAAAQAAVA